MNRINELMNKIINGDERIKAELEQLDAKYNLIDEVIGFRKEHKISQAFFANLINVDEEVIKKFERGEIDPQLSLISKMLFVMKKEMQIQNVEGEKFEFNGKKGGLIVPSIT